MCCFSAYKNLKVFSVVEQSGIADNFDFLCVSIVYCRILQNCPAISFVLQGSNPKMGRVVEGIAIRGQNALLRSLIEEKRLQIFTIFFIWRYTNCFAHSFPLLRILNTIVH